MKKYKERLGELTIDVANKFNDLIEEHKEFDFALAIAEEDGDMTNEETIEDYLEERDLFISLPTIECRNDISGNVFDVHVMKVNERGIYCVELEDTSRTHILKFSDIAGIYDQITLLTEMNDLK
jgi:hypothetical protein